MPKKPKETSHGLPVITPKTLALLKQLYGRKGEWGGHLEEVKLRIAKENPHLEAVSNNPQANRSRVTAQLSAVQSWMMHAHI